MIAIIGGGPAGSYLAYLLTKKKKRVSVYEEHEQVGLPVQCTGIVSQDFAEFMHGNRDFVINAVDRVKICAQEECIDFPISKNYVLDRAKFDAHLARMAQEEGAVYHFGRRFTGCRQVQGGYRLFFESGKTATAECLVGADGPLSQVARSAGLYGERRFFIGIQARAKLRNDNSVSFYPLNDGFGWCVPESRTVVRIGVATYRDARNVFEQFTRGKVKKKDFLGIQAGPIPIYRPAGRICKNGVYLVGDAAGHVKATTGGGILQGLKAAECLADALMEGEDYRRLVKRSIGSSLRLHLMMRQVFDRMEDKDWAGLVKTFQEKKLQKILSYKSRDKPLGLLLSLVLAKPQLVGYARFLLPPLHQRTQ